jgi:hypothetical protein
MRRNTLGLWRIEFCPREDGMNLTRKDFLMLVTLPARVNITETGWLLGFADHDIPRLISARLLKPLGRPARSGSKYFATVELQALRNDTAWLAKASDALVMFWRKKNVGRTCVVRTRQESPVPEPDTDPAK